MAVVEADIKQQVGRMIRDARKARGLTQKELGEKLGISLQAMSRYEQGQNLTIETLARVAHELGLKISDLTRGV